MSPIEKKKKSFKPGDNAHINYRELTVSNTDEAIPVRVCAIDEDGKKALIVRRDSIKKNPFVVEVSKLVSKKEIIEAKKKNKLKRGDLICRIENGEPVASTVVGVSQGWIQIVDTMSETGVSEISERSAILILQRSSDGGEK